VIPYIVRRQNLSLEPAHLANGCAAALPPKIQRIAGSRPSRSASFPRGEVKDIIKFAASELNP
jgi:hypothetical protein